MKRSVAVALFLVLISTSAPAAGAADDRSFDGRIGGSLDSFAARYGSPAALISTDDPVIYEHEDFSDFVVRYHKEKAFSVRVQPPVGTTWSARKAGQVARQFLPEDVELGDEVDDDDSSTTLVPCHSESLEREFGSKTFEERKLGGKKGDCHYALTVNDRRVTQVSVKVGLGKAVSPAPTTDAAPPATAEELVYLADVLVLSADVQQAFDRLAELMQDPRFADDDWVVDVAAQLAVLHVSYERIQALTPPPDFVRLHELTIEAFRLYDAAATHFAQGLETLDASLIDLAIGELNLANDYLGQAAAELDRIQAERGL